MDLTIEDDRAASRWQARADGEVVGYAAYDLAPGVLTMTHTVVDPAVEGHGIGGALVRAAFDDARERGLAVLPQCAYVRAWLARHPDQLDLVPVDRREQYGLQG